MMAPSKPCNVILPVLLMEVPFLTLPVRFMVQMVLSLMLPFLFLMLLVPFLLLPVRFLMVILTELSESVTTAPSCRGAMASTRSLPPIC